MSSTALKRPESLPRDDYAERALLSCLCRDEDSWQMVDGMKVEAFYNQSHGNLFTLMQDLFVEEGAPVCEYSVMAKLARSEDLAVSVDATGYGGISYVNGLPSVPPVGVAYYAKRVSEMHATRTLILGMREVEAVAMEGKTSPGDVIDMAEQMIQRVSLQCSGPMYGDSGTWVHLDDVLDQHQEALEQISVDRKAGKDIGVPLFLQTLRDHIKIDKPDLVIVGARPAMGKTAFALGLAKGCGDVLVSSLEMSGAQLAQRWLAAEAGIDLSKSLRGYMSSRDQQALSFAKDGLRDRGLYFDDRAGLKVEQIVKNARRFKRAHPEMKMLVVDYIGLMADSGAGGARHDLEIAHRAKVLKDCAKDLGIVVVALSQLSRGVESRDDKRPVMSDLKNSSGIEQAADVIMFLYRDDYYNGEDSETPGETEIIFAKYRSGNTQTLSVGWHGPTMSFSDIDGSTRSLPDPDVDCADIPKAMRAKIRLLCNDAIKNSPLGDQAEDVLAWLKRNGG